VVKLKRLSLKKRRDCEHPEVNLRKLYLARTEFGWKVGRFNREHYGLCLVNPTDMVVCYQLSEIKELYLLLL
jgi:hypothetical protein